MKKFVFLFLISIFLQSCMGVNSDIQTIKIKEEPPAREWTFIIYMAADNDLEQYAIHNFNQLEAVRYGNAPISIIVLLDRSPYYDQTNGNWSDTRLFEIISDPEGHSPIMKSPRLNSWELGLFVDKDTDLNTADWRVLSGLIDFAKRVYPAEHYALFIWGHGTGWSSIAHDDTSKDSMSLPDFRRAIAGKNLSVIGFDTCFGAVLEVVYEIKDHAELFIGSQGLIPASGWDYYALFTDFIQNPDLSISNLGKSIQKQFSELDIYNPNAAISQIQLSQVGNLFNKFENFTGIAANSITTFESREAVSNVILNDVEGHFFVPTPSELYIDIFDFSKKITAIRTAITSNSSQQNAILNASNELEEALNLAVPLSWAHNGTTNKIAVHVIHILDQAVPASRHRDGYIRGSVAMDKCNFVQHSTGWVPAVPLSNSFLDKLFYWEF